MLYAAVVQTSQASETRDSLADTTSSAEQVATETCMSADVRAREHRPLAEVKSKVIQQRVNGWGY